MPHRKAMSFGLYLFWLRVTALAPATLQNPLDKLRWPYLFLFLRKDWLNNRWAITLVRNVSVFILWSLTTQCVAAQRLEPIGTHLITGVSAVDGYGIQIGSVSAKTLYVTELVLLSDLHPWISGSSANSRVVLSPGISIRLLGFERLIGGAPYRGYDLDVGFRAGPGLSFARNETQADKDRRFELVVEPFLRWSAARSTRWIWYAEAGSSRPNLRAGLWIRY